MPNDLQKTAQELVDEFTAMLQKADPDYNRTIGRELYAAASRFIEERVYDADKHAQLGRHVEAIMKHFKGV